MLLLDENEKAKTGKGGIQTDKNILYKSNKIPFLRLYDTRGIELGQKYNSDSIYYNAKEVIQESMKGENFNDFVHCIWYCIRGINIEAPEIEYPAKVQSDVLDYQSNLSCYS